MPEEKLQQYMHVGSSKSWQRDLKEDSLMIISKFPVLYEHEK